MLRAGRYDFDDPVGRAVATFVIQLIQAADDGDVRLYIVFAVLAQKDGKRRRVYSAGAALLFNVVPYFVMQTRHDFLMDAAWRRHVI